jgi:hypothetical protein
MWITVGFFYIALGAKLAHDFLLWGICLAGALIGLYGISSGHRFGAAEAPLARAADNRTGAPPGIAPSARRHRGRLGYCDRWAGCAHRRWRAFAAVCGPAPKRGVGSASGRVVPGVFLRRRRSGWPHPGERSLPGAWNLAVCSGVGLGRLAVVWAANNVSHSVWSRPG